MNYSDNIADLISQGKKHIKQGKSNEARDCLDMALVLLGEATMEGKTMIGSRGINLVKTKVWNLLEKNRLILPES